MGRRLLGGLGTVNRTDLIQTARGKYKSLDGLVVVSPRLLSDLADALEQADTDIKWLRAWIAREDE